MDIFKLVGSVFVDTDEANKSLSKTDEKAEGLGNKLSSGIKTAGKWALGLTAAAGAVGGAMIKSAKDTASNMDVIDKASQRMEMDAESYQKLAYAAELSGVSTSQLESASKKLKANMGDDADLIQYITDLANMEDATERNEKASELFGSAVAQDLIPMLNAGGDGINAMMQEAVDLGQVMSNDSVKAGAEMNDTFTKIDGVITNVKNSIGTALMPVVNDLLNWILQHMPEIQAFVGDVINFIIALIDELKPIIKSLVPVIEEIFKIVKPLWNNILKPILTGILLFLDGVFTGDWTKIWKGLANIVEGIFKGLVEVIKLPINAIIGLLNIAIDGFNNIKIPDWVPGVGGKGLNIPKIPMLANGGEITQSGTVLVGERGPEFLNLPTGARVTPLDKATSIDYDRMTESFVRALMEVMPQMNRNVVLDSGALVGQLAPSMNDALGNIAVKSMRGAI